MVCEGLARAPPESCGAVAAFSRPLLQAGADAICETGLLGYLCEEVTVFSEIIANPGERPDCGGNRSLP